MCKLICNDPFVSSYCVWFISVVLVIKIFAAIQFANDKLWKLSGCAGVSNYRRPGLPFLEVGLAEILTVVARRASK